MVGGMRDMAEAQPRSVRATLTFEISSFNLMCRAA